MKYKCVIFDLDGTLIDSLQGILDAINLTFKQFGFKVERKYNEAKGFIGAGAIEFARRAMNGQPIPVDKERDIMESFLINYDKIQKEETKPFNGIIEMLKNLKKCGYFVCIASNKPQILLDPIVKILFENFEFDAALGSRPNKPEKPDPFIVFEIMNKFKLSSSDCLYIGDSEYDYLTAKNAGIDCLITKYGYGYYDQPWVKKVNYTVNSVEELTKLLTENFSSK